MFLVITSIIASIASQKQNTSITDPFLLEYGEEDNCAFTSEKNKLYAHVITEYIDIDIYTPG